MLIICLITFLSFISCSRETEPLNFGTDICEHCKMTIMDKKFGGEIITGKGKIYKFDALECQVKFELENFSDERIESYAINFYVPGELINTANSSFVISDNISSPMGGNLGAFSNRSEAKKFIKENGGEIYDLNSLKKKFNKTIN